MRISKFSRRSDRGVMAQRERWSAPFILVLIFMAVAAIAGGSSRWNSAGQIIINLTAIALIAVLVSRRERPDFRRWRVPIAFVFAYAAWILLQLVDLPPVIWTMLPGREPYATLGQLLEGGQPWRPINLSPARGWNALSALLPPFAMLLGLASLTLEERRRLLGVAIGIVCGSLLFGVAQLSVPGLKYHYARDLTSASGFFANRNHQAVLLAAGLPMLAGIHLVGLRLRLFPRWLALGCGVVILIMIPVTGSRMGLVCALFGLVFAVAINIPRLRALLCGLKPLHMRLALCAAAVAIAAVLIAALRSDRAFVMDRIAAMSLDEDRRSGLIGPLIAMARAFFPIGSGVGSFDPVYRQFEPIEMLSPLYMNQAHNDFAQVLIEGGLPAGALVLLFLVWWLRAAWTLRPGAEPSRQVHLGRVGLAVTGLFMIASLVDYPLRTSLAAVIFVLACGWINDRHAGRPVPSGS